MGVFTKLSNVFHKPRGGQGQRSGEQAASPKPRPTSDAATQKRPQSGGPTPRPAGSADGQGRPSSSPQAAPKSAAGTATANRQPGPGSARSGVAQMRPEHPIGMEVETEPKPRPTAQTEVDPWEDNEEDVTPQATPSGKAITTPKSRQEMMAQLQENYKEVLSLVRKVDGHLDRQERRSQRLMEIAEQIPDSLQVLPELRDQNKQIVEAVHQLVDVSKSNQDRTDKGMLAQQEAVDRVRDLLDRSGKTTEEVASSLAGFQKAVDGMAGSNERLGEVLESMRKRDAARDSELSEMISKNHRAMTTALIVCGVLVVVAVIVVTFAS